MTYRLLALAVVLFLAGAAHAQDRATKVRNDREQLKDSQVWIYNDLAEGFKAARRSGKPLFVTIRCIPCEACSRFDKKLLDRQNEVQDLLDKFVCVRVVQGNHLDLQLFQFDYDQSFHAFFLNADKTIYGRFGTRSAREEEADMTMPGLRQAMLAALDLHGQYPANKERLQGKQSHPVEFAVPGNIPISRANTPKSSTTKATSWRAASTVIKSATPSVSFIAAETNRSPSRCCFPIRCLTCWVWR
jgi:serine protease Do